MTRNPASQVTKPTVVNTAPRELTPEQRYVLKNRVEAEQSPRQSAIFALGYWAGLRISEVAQLRLEQCSVNQRSGQITILDSKGGKTRTIDLHNEALTYEIVGSQEVGGKTRTIDLHNEARRALYNYLFNEDRSEKFTQIGTYLVFSSCFTELPTQLLHRLHFPPN
jgi:site-specific recombinase XerD